MTRSNEPDREPAVGVASADQAAFSDTPVPTDAVVPSPTPVPAAVATPSDTPAPTEGPVPSDTPAATGAPAPSDAPAPTRTGAPVPDPEPSEPPPEVVNGDYEIVTLLPKDAIPAIFDPQFLTAQEADEWYDPDELVLGVEIDGDARAYSIPFLSGREIVNDEVGGRKIAVTW